LNKWTEEENKKLSDVILERIYRDLKPLDEKKILVLCSSEGDVAFWLVEKNKNFGGKVLGLELNEECLKKSVKRAKEKS